VALAGGQPMLWVALPVLALPVVALWRRWWNCRWHRRLVVMVPMAATVMVVAWCAGQRPRVVAWAVAREAAAVTEAVTMGGKHCKRRVVLEALAGSR